MKKISKKILGVTFILLIMTMAIANCGAFRDFYRHDYPKYSKQSTSERFMNSVKTIRDRYVKQIKWKTFFVEINGGFTRLIGKKECNKIVRLKNGMLLGMQNASPSKLLPQTIEKVVSASQEINKLGIPFLYVNLPLKLDVDNALLPPGVSHVTHAETDNFLGALRKEGVEVLDTRPLLVSSIEDVEKYFYATDHHWNARGALKVAPAIATKIGELLSLPNLDLTRLDEANWETHIKKNWWFGSEGQRVGRLYGGLDDFIYLTPKFRTDMTVVIPSKHELRKGKFDETNIVKKFLDIKPDSWKTSAYLAHMGLNHPLLTQVNMDNVTPAKVLIVQDSYMLPLQGFLSMIFKEVNVVDLRYFKECSLVECVRRMRPDIVVVAINYSTRDGIASKINLNMDTCNENLSVKWMRPVLTLPASEKSSHNYVALEATLENEETYVLEIEKIEVLEGTSKGISFSLRDFEAKKTHTWSLFDIDYSNQHGGICWEFTVPKSGNWDVLSYAGIIGKTQKNSIRLHNVRVSKRVP